MMTFDQANRWLANRVNLPTGRGSAEISREVPAKVRAHCFFSARVAEARILERLRAVSDAFSRHEIGLAEARTKLKEFLIGENGYLPGSGLTNLASTARLNLILEQNARMAAAVGMYQAGRDPDIEERFPCWRYVGSTSINPRDSHAKYNGMVFRKDDPIWHRIFPPWDFGCKCSVEDCDDEPSKPIKVDAPESGFAFDPAHAFEEFDGMSIHDPEGRAAVIDEMARRFPNETREIYASNAEGYLEGKAVELRRRVAEESENKVFPKEPKEFLKGENLKRAEAEARKAVLPEVMDAVDQKIREIGVDAIEPFRHYSSRPGDSENIAVREAVFKDGKLDWTGTGVSKERQKSVADLQNLLDIMPKFHGTLYRGCSFEDKKDVRIYLQKILNAPESLKGFISTTPDPVIAQHYASTGNHKVIVVVPNSKNGVYFGPHSTHPEDEEALISYKFYLKGLKTIQKDDILYVLAEEVPR